MFAKACKLGLEGIVSKPEGGVPTKSAELRLAEDEEREFPQDQIAMPSPAMLHQPTREGFSTASSFSRMASERFVASRSTLAKVASALAKLAQ